jgi:tetratricopeptide (TPR) repeat protein
MLEEAQMHRGATLILCLALLPWLPSLAQAQLPEKLAEAQKAYDGRKDPASMQKAIDLWKKVLEEDPANVEAAWKLSRAAVWWGDHAAKDKKESAHKQGMAWGELAVKAGPKNPEAIYWLAANMGSYGRAHGIMESLSMIKPMKEKCEQIFRIDPSYWRAHMLLGMLYRKAPGWPISIGDDDKAVKELEAAVKIAPSIPRALYELGLGYLEAGKEDRAKETLKKAIDAPPEPEFELESVETKEKARKKLAEL